MGKITHCINNKKTGKDFVLKIITYIEDDVHYILIKDILKKIDSKKDLSQYVGFCNFRIKGRKAWIYNIKINDEKYLACGIGKLMLDIMEGEMANNYVSFVEGKWYPEGKGANRSRQFWERNGYDIYKDDYEWFLEKSGLIKNKFSSLICFDEENNLEMQ